MILHIPILGPAILAAHHCQVRLPADAKVRRQIVDGFLLRPCHAVVFLALTGKNNFVAADDTRLRLEARFALEPGRLGDGVIA